LKKLDHAFSLKMTFSPCGLSRMQQIVKKMNLCFERR